MNGEVCIYDEKSRGRRGPRPRRQPDKIVHNIAPAPKAAETCAGQPTVLINDRRRESTHSTVDRPLSLSPTGGPPSIARGFEEVVEVADPAEDEPDSTEGGALDTSDLKSSLEQILVAGTNPRYSPALSLR